MEKTSADMVIIFWRLCYPCDSCLVQVRWRSFVLVFRLLLLGPRELRSALQKVQKVMYCRNDGATSAHRHSHLNESNVHVHYVPFISTPRQLDFLLP